MIPAALDVLIAPVDRSAVAAVDRRDELDHVLGFDLSAFGEVARRVHRRVRLGLDALLGAPQVAFRFDCATMRADEPLKASLLFCDLESGVLGGFLLWFDAELSPSVRLSNLGDRPTNHWGQAFLTVEPRSLDEDSRFALELSIDDSPSRFRIDWRLRDPVTPRRDQW